MRLPDRRGICPARAANSVDLPAPADDDGDGDLFHYQSDYD